MSTEPSGASHVGGLVRVASSRAEPSMDECEPEVIMVDGPPAEFSITIKFDGARAVPDIRGSVDLLSAPELATILDAVITLGYCSVVLDLRLSAIDTSGLRVIAYAASRLVVSGGELTIRCPSVMGIWTFDVTWLTELVRIELPELASEHLGPEQSAHAPSTPLRTNLLEVAHDLRRVSPIPADDDAVDGALRLVVALARATVGGAEGVSVSLRRHGRLATVAASDETISAMDADQYAHRGGPLRRRLARGTLVSRRVPGPKDPVAGIHAESPSSRDQRHPLFTAARPRSTRGSPQYLLPQRDCLRAKGPGAGVGVRHRGLDHPDRRGDGRDR